MKAITRDSYGSPDVLELRDVDRPAVTPDGVLVHVRASSVNPFDWHLLRGEPYLARPFMGGTLKPASSGLGGDVAGVVEAVGDDVTELQPGDEVFGSRLGSLAEYVLGRERNFAPKPAGLTFEEAAAIPSAGITALQAVRDHGRAQAGQQVLVNGAAGGVGTFAVQIAKAFGAKVTGVCSTRNVDLVRSLGADRVLDYTTVDFTREGQRYDVIVDCVANRSLRRLARAVKRDGTIVIVGGKRGRLIGGMTKFFTTRLVSRFVSHRVVSFVADIRKDELLVLNELVEAGKVTPVIDRTYALREAPEAIRYLEAGHARGKVVVTV